MRSILIASACLSLIATAASAEALDPTARLDLVCQGTMSQIVGDQYLGKTRWRGRIKIDGARKMACIDEGQGCRPRRMKAAVDDGYSFDIGPKDKAGYHHPERRFFQYIYYKSQGAIPSKDTVQATCRREPFSGF